jgi:uncharacterized SAM-binding protein YcdF (DUF218 family)
MYQVFVWYLLQPFTLMFLVSGVLLLSLWRRRQERRRRLVLLTAAFAVFTLMCLPAVAHLALGSLEWWYPVLHRRPADVEAIVVLSSGTRLPAEGGVPAELDEDALERCIKAAEMYHHGKRCLVLASGGKSDPSRPEPACADVMRDFLVQLGVGPADVLVENLSTTTYENATASAELLNDRGIHKIMLVTSATHLPRAVGCFRKQGLDVVPCGCFYHMTYQPFAPARFLPTATAAQDNGRVAHEWLGLAWYWVRGRL